MAKTKTQFYPRVVNNTNIEFSDEEIALLNKVVNTTLQNNNLLIQVQDSELNSPIQKDRHRPFSLPEHTTMPPRNN